MAESKTSQLVVRRGPQELILLRMDWRVPGRQSKFRKAVLSDVQAFYSWLRKKTIKGGSALRLQAMLLFSQEVNSTFEAAVEGLYWVSAKLPDKRHLKGNGPSTSVHGPSVGANRAWHQLRL